MEAEFCAKRKAETAAVQRLRLKIDERLKKLKKRANGLMDAQDQRQLKRIMDQLGVNVAERGFSAPQA